MYEYAALSWDTHVQREDRRFVLARNQLLEGGWLDCLQASWRGSPGGACIMRRPKDEPPRFHRDRHGELVREDEPHKHWTRTQIEDIALNMVLKHEEWGDKTKEETTADEPRMWTETELRAFVQRVLAADRDGLKVGDVRFVGGSRVMVGPPIPQEASEEGERAGDVRLSGKINHGLAHPSSVLVGRPGIHADIGRGDSMGYDKNGMLRALGAILDPIRSHDRTMLRAEATQLKQKGGEA